MSKLAHNSDSRHALCLGVLSISEAFMAYSFNGTFLFVETIKGSFHLWKEIIFEFGAF